MDLLYHYCSVDTFVKIIKNRCLWMCDPTKSNDRLELKQADIHYRDVFNSFVEDPKERNYIEEAITHYKESKDIDSRTEQPFVFCLSTQKDLLSQWKMYGDDGYGVAIGFDLGRFPGDTENQLYCSKVEYDVEEQRQMLKMQIYTLIQRLKESYKREVPPEQTDIHKLINAKGQSLEAVTVLLKDPSFMQEDEYRIVYRHLFQGIDSKSWDNLLLEDYEIDGPKFEGMHRTIHQHFELKFPYSIIKSIVLGPQCKLFPNEVKLFLDKSVDKYFKDKDNKDSINIDKVNIDCTFEESNCSYGESILDKSRHIRCHLKKTYELDKIL